MNADVLVLGRMTEAEVENWSERVEDLEPGAVPYRTGEQARIISQ